MIKDDNYIVVQGWMVTDLKLKGNELLVFAIIYGFSQDGESRFTGSRQYLADWTNSTKQGIQKNLKSLLEKGYIQKEERTINGVKLVDYRATKFTGGGQQSLLGGGQQSCPHNIDIDKPNKSNRFIPPTVDEVRAYCIERGNNVDPERFVDYYTSKGWMIGKNKMKDWKAAVRTWERGSTGGRKKKQDLDDFYGMMQEWVNEG